MTLKLQLVIKAETDLSFAFTTAIIFMSNIFPGLGERIFFYHQKYWLFTIRLSRCLFNRYQKN